MTNPITFIFLRAKLFESKLLLNVFGGVRVEKKRYSLVRDFSVRSINCFPFLLNWRPLKETIASEML